MTTTGHSLTLDLKGNLWITNLIECILYINDHCPFYKVKNQKQLPF
jgi:hypothetical protein